MYFLPESLKAAILAINELPVIDKTLWFRIPKLEAASSQKRLHIYCTLLKLIAHKVALERPLNYELPNAALKLTS
ncbi:hypothetical protein [Nostoc sp. MG11]|uniref:hypothetical protein n=1 Tax=Nostoc sp. MG11 TaxID=2721166 RepID=UPI001D01C290|nr:hypothetical protein [Nostoc sp. MG11]